MKKNTHWPTCPTIYEINTWVWLNELSQKYKSQITLDNIPAKEWDELENLKVNAIWFMGVWERSQAGVEIALKNEGLMADFKRALPDLRTEDIVGSPYCIRRYVVDSHLGGPAGLAVARQELAKRGLLLVLDFVPNHVAPDHPWTKSHPDFFIRGTQEDLRIRPDEYYEVNGQAFACGRDPYFPPWPDVLQLNAFNPDLRQEIKATLSDIASQCDAVRCDMAMLMINSVFLRTWGSRAGDIPLEEYWSSLIKATKIKHPNFLFIAEAYWDMEWDLQQQGFDFCYDKRLYDRLEHENAENIRLHLCADPDYQDKLVRFIENHDEPRAAATFSLQKELAAAVLVATQRGARLYHEGQFEGRKVRLPVFLGRRPAEPEDGKLSKFYKNLLAVTSQKVFHNGEWALCRRTGWEGNSTHINLVVWCWWLDSQRYILAINLSDAPAKGNANLPWNDLENRNWKLMDALSGEVFKWKGEEIVDKGLYLSLPAWGIHFFELLENKKVKVSNKD